MGSFEKGPLNLICNSWKFQDEFDFACCLWLQDSPDTNREQILKLSVSIYFYLNSTVKLLKYTDATCSRVINIC